MSDPRKFVHNGPEAPQRLSSDSRRHARRINATRYSWCHSPLFGAGVMACALLSNVAGCGTSALPPPIRITYRSSILGIGKVVQIYNNSAHHLYNVKVVGRNFEKVQSGSVRAADDLPPNGSIEVGWAEFGAWVPEPGETIEIYADGFLVPQISVVPK